MRDGVTLRVNLYRPEGPGPFPVILCAHPYGKDNVPKRKGRRWSLNIQYRMMRQPEPVTFSSETTWEAPDPVWWTQQGYAVVNADLRGAGTSEGEGTLLADPEARDVYDLIEWAGAQDWSNGNVGMLGVSYLAISQYKAAALRPPSLKAIAPWEGFTDAYRDLFEPGGMVEDGFTRVWLLGVTRTVRVTENIGKQWKLHPQRDEWWETLVPDLPRIEVPMLICTSFSDNDMHTRGSFRAFEHVGSKDRFAYTHRGPKWATFYSEEARGTQLGFFDRYLKGMDVPKPARVRLEVRDRGDHIAQVRTENEWPLARTDWRDLYLAEGGLLRAEAPSTDGSVTFATRRKAAAFTLAVDNDLELSGPMTLQTWVSVEGADDVGLFVGVEKWSRDEWIPFEGSYGFGRDRVTTGWQRASARELDAAASAPHQPVLTLRHPQPLRAGEVVPLTIELGPSSTLFRAGDSLRLLVAGRSLSARNPLFGTFPRAWVPTARARCTLHWGLDRPARLTVPAIPASPTP
jgi:hypothetical protein